MGNVCMKGGGAKSRSSPKMRQMTAEEEAIQRANPEEPLAVKGDIRDFYDIDSKVLGRGQYGEVRKALHRKTNGQYVVKTILKNRVRRPEVLRRENEFLLRSNHPNLCNVVDIFENDRAMYIVQDYYDGGEMFDAIVDRYSNNSEYKEHDVCVIVQQLLNGIAYCHDTLGICHRDLKPENIMFREKKKKTPEGNVVIIDFGLAASIGDKDATSGTHDHMSTKVGTPYYMAPEIFSGDYGRECDLWSIGVIAYVLMCGYPPFGGNDQNEIMRTVRDPHKNVRFHKEERWGHVSKESIAFIQSLLNRDPSARPSAKTALEHPWFSKTKTSDLPLAETIGPALERFHNMSQMKRMASIAVASQINDSKEVVELRKIFQKIDVNNDGTIGLSELKAALKEWPANSIVKLDSLFESLDQDGKGVLNYEEFLAATVPPTLAMKDANIEKAFKMFDTDDTGFISLENLQDVCGGDEAQLLMLLNDGDFCHDGKISLAEFKHMMKLPEHKTTLTKKVLEEEKRLTEEIAKRIKDGNYDPVVLKLKRVGNQSPGLRLEQLNLSDGNSIVIVAGDKIPPNSVAAESGVQGWDAINSINGKECSKMTNFTEIREALRTGIKNDGCDVQMFRLSKEERMEAFKAAGVGDDSGSPQTRRRSSTKHVTFSISKVV